MFSMIAGLGRPLTKTLGLLVCVVVEKNAHHLRDAKKKESHQAYLTLSCFAEYDLFTRCICPMRTAIDDTARIHSL
jgi:hypothetical protein